MFLYVVRVLDRRTDRVIEYVTARPRIPLFVVEVGNYRAGEGSLLVPRALGVPPWVTASPADSAAQAADAEELIRQMDELAASLGVDTG